MVLASSLTDTQGIVALAAGAVAVVALLVCLVLALAVRRLRAAQRAVLGDGKRDLVAHAADLQLGFDALSRHMDEVAERLDRRLAAAEAGVHGAISHYALVRYDAYNELSGRQSVSIALLDGSSSGIVLTCIHHRDQARVYIKRVDGGRGELELSPEEVEAVQLALAPRGGDQISIEQRLSA
jgi:hypothetical protein